MRKFLLTIAMLMSLFLTTSLLAAPVNINQATAEQLAENLNGIGIKKAQAIVNYREKIGEFHNMQQLLNVKGIGAATLEKNEANIIIE